MLKSILRPVLRKIGFDLVRYAPDPRHAPRLRNRWLNELGVTLLLDVGANSGQYAREVRESGYAGKMISFEPLADAFHTLQQKTAGDPNWSVQNVGLGSAPGTLKINIAGNSQSSSFLPMLDRHASAAPASSYISTQEARIITLDSLPDIQPKEVIWLKLDTQGFEMSVLRGAEKILDRVVAIECELSFVPLYRDGPLIEEVLSLLAARGFRLVAFADTDSFVDPKNLHTLQVNGTFIRQSPR